MAHSHFMHHIITQIAQQQNITDQYLHKQTKYFGQHSQTISFFTRFHFKSLLVFISYHQIHIADYLTYIIVKA